MGDLQALELIGFTLPSPIYLLGAIVFGLIGYAGYRYGKKADVPTAKWIGIALMLYPYVISETWLLYFLGVALCVGLFASSR
jgi:chromate transport protein ChrA